MKVISSFFALVVMTVLGCSAELPEPQRGVQVRSSCPDRVGDEYFFEQGIVSLSSEYDRRFRIGLGEYLRSANAPSLSCDTTLREAYRLLWIEPFRPAVIVQASKADGAWHVIAWRFAHPATRQRLLLEDTSQREVEASEFRPVMQALEDAEFWRVPEFQSSTADDPTTIAIEGQRGRAYRVVTRVSPFGDEWKRVAQTLMAVANVDTSHLTAIR